MSEMTFKLANAEKVALLALADVVKPPPPVDYVKWAEDNIVFSARESQFKGPYNRDVFGYFDEVLRALAPTDPCRIVTLKGSAQIGKTVVGNVFAGGTMDLAPCDFAFYHPTDDNAARWSRMKWMPFVRQTASLRSIFSTQSREGGNSVLYKERKDGAGALLISGSNSDASTSLVSIEKQVQDDLSKWEGDEGQADSRSNSREFAKILKTSTPLIEPGCKITRNFDDGSQERFFVPCPHCSAMQTLSWENMFAQLDEDHPEKAHFTCVECGGVIEQHHRPAMRRRGEWRADNPKAMRFHRSFEIWSAYSDLMSWERIARAWFKAKGDPKAEQTFFNDVLGLAWRTTGEAPPWETLRDRASQSERPHGIIPVGHPVLTCGVDCQKDRVEWHVVAWGPDYKSATVEYGVIVGHISSVEAQSGLDALLQQGFKNAYGRMIKIDMLAIDGNAWTEDVWAWAKKHPTSKVIMVRGVESEAAPLLQKVKKERSRSGKLLPYSSRFYNFATSVMKMGLYRNLVKTDPLMRGFVDLPSGLDDEFYRQLTAERRVPKKGQGGRIRYIWDKDPTQANEGLDTRLQAEAAWIKIASVTRELLDKVWAKFFAERETAPDEAQLDLEDWITAPQPSTEQTPAVEVVRQPQQATRRRKQRKMRINN